VEQCFRVLNGIVKTTTRHVGDVVNEYLMVKLTARNARRKENVKKLKEIKMNLVALPRRYGFFPIFKN